MKNIWNEGIMVRILRTCLHFLKTLYLKHAYSVTSTTNEVVCSLVT